MKAPFVRSAYNYDVDKASDESGLKCEDASLAQQHMRDDSDINVIVSRFLKTGILPEQVRLPTYGDFEDVFDFRSAQDAIIRARDSFMRIPPEVRARFGGDPQLFVEFCSDPANLPELRKMGLAPEVKSVGSEGSGGGARAEAGAAAGGVEGDGGSVSGAAKGA